VVSAGVCEEVFINWLQSEPRLLLWLSTLYRISASEAVQHRVRCHVCKAFPITGLRYRCVKCVSLHLCQTCFLTEKRSRKHKPSHPILEYCTQPSWKESLASLASSARHVLLPRRFTRREAERRRALSRGESNIDPHSNNSTSLTNDVCLSSKSRDSSPQVNVASKALQTEESQLPERKASVLQKDLHVTQKFIKELQRDKWLLEKEFQVWRAAAQSEHNSLEDRCAELEATMEELSQHNQNLERELRHMQHSLSLREQNNHTSSRIISEGMSVTQSQWSDSPESHDSSNREEEDEEEILEGGQTEEQEVEDHVPREHYPDKEDLDSSLRSEPMDVTFDLISEGAFLGEKEIERSRQYEEEKCGSDDGEDVDEEQQLCDLVQQIRTDLSQHTSTESASCVQHWLLEAAEGVGHSICHLISSTNFRNPPVSPAHDHCFLTYK
uniref:ZZ-type domain-containing protein n=2 Tax=Denticeps clupeoides TaxID=299321 RepID=A0AAY4AND6_9TELE